VFTAGVVPDALSGLDWLELSEPEHEERKRQETEKSKTYLRMRIFLDVDLSD
jgi:hypothetical protein